MSDIPRTPPDPQTLERVLSAEPVDPDRLAAELDRIEKLLSSHTDEVRRAGGLINDEDRINRPSLDRQESKLMQQVRGLRRQVAALQERAAQHDADEPTLRQEAEGLAQALKRLRDAEADLAFEATNTDLGSGE
jgi:hypothetical protein